MATGAQDWIVRTDALLQTLAELIVRQKNGTPGFGDGYSTIIDRVKTKIFSLSGKGVLYGGLVWIDNDIGEYLGEMTLVLDGVDMGTYTLESLAARAVFSPGLAAFYLNQYDLVSGNFTVGFSQWMTFETGIEIWYTPDTGLAVVQHRIHYAVI